VRVTAPSACSWLDHVVSGLIRLTCRPIQTRFRYASTLRLKLARQTNSLTHYTKGTWSPARQRRTASSLLKTKQRDACARMLSHSVRMVSMSFVSARFGNDSPLVSRLPLFVGVRFQVCFTPLVGVLFTFPSRYWFAIGRARVLRLGRWSSHVRTGFHVSRLTRGSSFFLPVRGYHPVSPFFPERSGS
jgi:hypothetical protein